MKHSCLQNQEQRIAADQPVFSLQTPGRRYDLKWCSIVPLDFLIGAMIYSL